MEGIKGYYYEVFGQSYDVNLDYPVHDSKEVVDFAESFASEQLSEQRRKIEELRDEIEHPSCILDLNYVARKLTKIINQ